MILLINGAFGSGKTTLAEALTQHLPNALIFDPEEVGFFLRKILTPIDPQPEDFQHYSLWRRLTLETAKLLQEKYGRDLIIPMTIWRIDYFNEIIQGLKGIDANFLHICLTAPTITIKERLRARGELLNSWAEQQAEHCVSAFTSTEFEWKIDTHNKSPEEVLAVVLKQLSLLRG